jgi:protein-S-isoprenylcysteine O-methyltransferase Ste14
LNRSPLDVCGYLWLAWGLIWIVAAKKTEKTELSESLTSRLSHLIPLGVTFWLVFSSASPISWRYDCLPIRWTGTAVTFLGLSFAVWARYHLGRYWSGVITLKEGHKIIRTGPYAFARHPIYTGFLAGILGAAIAGGRPQGFAGFSLVLFAYLRKVKREEAFLAEQFGPEYQDYRQTVGAFLPRWP